MNQSLSLESFRQEIQLQLMEKGIVPPKPNSAREQALYQQWLQGKQKTQKLNDGH